MAQKRKVIITCAVIAAGWLLAERAMAASPAHEAGTP